jgi:hypothetical protein
MNHSPLRLPRQWRHWCRLAGLRTQYHRRIQSSHWTLQGLGRNWRVNSRGVFQVSCVLEDFDRWSNSTLAEVSLPQSLAEFEKSVRLLLNHTDVAHSDPDVTVTLNHDVVVLSWNQPQKPRVPAVGPQTP